MNCRPQGMLAQDGHDDHQRFLRLYRENVVRVERFARRVCGRSEDAKDLVQETFLDAFRGLRTFRGDAKASTWLLTIAAHAYSRMRRRRGGEVRQELSLEGALLTSAGELRLQIPAGGLNPEERCENGQRRRLLREAIRSVPGRSRLVLVLRDLEGLTAREVGVLMGLGERAVKSRLHRARKCVRRHLTGTGAHLEAARPTDSHP